MLSDFFKKLTGGADQAPLPELDLRIASGALLVRIAKTDAHYAFEEIAKIDAILAEQHGLNPIEAAKLRATCEKIEAEGPDTETFTDLVRSAVPQGEREQLCAALEAVSRADHQVKPEEVAFLARVTEAFSAPS